RAVETIGAEALRLDTLIRGLYGYVSLDGTDEQLQEVDLTDVLQAAQANAAAAYGVKLLITVADGLPVVEGYRRQLEQLFTQLLDNAVKFRRPEQAPRVRITCREVQENSFRATEGRYRYVDHARITIEDEGIGFEERYGAYIFEALRKIDPKTPGLGLGLAICKKVVEHHYGSIRAEPRPGGGSRFIVSLPMRQ
ncbi:MAG TPA: HAMP domain-containing sensor histidine kinase, partial [Rhodothermales bacterium]|nr:HAMP domain-containing sensor histidine kinase [Rhodothermales bacterium]